MPAAAIGVVRCGAVRCGAVRCARGRVVFNLFDRWANIGRGDQDCASRHDHGRGYEYGNGYGHDNHGRCHCRDSKGPMLRNLAPRAPYFHNGSAKDLWSVVEFYNTRFHIGFIKQEKSDLVAFLRSP